MDIPTGSLLGRGAPGHALFTLWLSTRSSVIWTRPSAVRRR